MKTFEKLKLAIIVARHVQKDYIFQKWSKFWLYRTDRSEEAAYAQSKGTSPGSIAAKAAANYARSLLDLENKTTLENVVSKLSADSLVASKDRLIDYDQEFDIVMFKKELEKYPEDGPPKLFKKLTHGATEEDIAKLLREQKGRCYICGIHHNVAVRPRGYGLVVDHDHKTGAVRGLLCNNCNRMLGLGHDSENLFIKAAEYIKKSSQPS